MTMFPTNRRGVLGQLFLGFARLFDYASRNGWSRIGGTSDRAHTRAGGVREAALRSLIPLQYAHLHGRRLRRRRSAGNHLAGAYLTAGHADLARTRFEQLTRVDPASAKAWQGLGLSCREMSRRAFRDLEQVA